MKSQFLQLNKPCSENWDDMQPNDAGNFCAMCAKTVIDFTGLAPVEIAQQMKKAKGSLCARVSAGQLNMPLPSVDTEYKYTLPYSNIAAGIMIATTLAACQPSQSKNQTADTELVLANATAPSSGLHTAGKPPGPLKTEDFTTIQGIVHDSTITINRAKITFCSVEKMISVYSGEDGKFSLKVPTALIDNDNVIRVSYREVIDANGNERPYSYDTTDHVLTKKDTKSAYNIAAKQMLLFAGGIGRGSRDWNPIVVSNGKEIPFADFIKAQDGKKSSCDLTNKEYYLFESRAAVAIYGTKAKDGLYILTDKK